MGRNVKLPYKLVDKADLVAKVAISADGQINLTYEALGGQAVLGDPVIKETGSIWTFANGSCICYNATAHEAFEIHGAIYAKWVSLGGLKWGVPSTSELGTPDGVGRYNHFNNNSASIYWTPGTGAAAVWGAIRAKWAAIGWRDPFSAIQ